MDGRGGLCTAVFATRVVLLNHIGVLADYINLVLSWLLLAKTKDFQSSSMSLDLCENVSISAFIDARWCWFKSLRTVGNSALSNQNNRFELNRVGTSKRAVSLTMALNLHASLTFPRVQTWQAWSRIENPLVILSNFLFLTRGTKALIQLQTMNQWKWQTAYHNAETSNTILTVVIVFFLLMVGRSETNCLGFTTLLSKL